MERIISENTQTNYKDNYNKERGSLLNKFKTFSNDMNSNIKNNIVRNNTTDNNILKNTGINFNHQYYNSLKTDLVSIWHL